MADTNEKGNFVAYMNRNKQYGDSKPSFEGRISIPGTKTEHRIALWNHSYTDPKTGEQRVAFNGKAQVNAYTDAPTDQIASIAKAAGNDTILQGSLTIACGHVVMFENHAKNEPSKSGNERPDYYGYYHPHQGGPIVQIGAWARKDRFKNPMLSGVTSYKPTDPEQDQADAKAKVNEMIADGTVTKGTKSKGKGKSKGDDAGMSR